MSDMSHEFLDRATAAASRWFRRTYGANIPCEFEARACEVYVRRFVWRSTSIERARSARLRAELAEARRESAELRNQIWFMEGDNA